MEASRHAELKQIRWKQRFENLQKALKRLQRGILLDEPNDLEVQGIIQSFEFSFELAWKTLKDYLESQGVLASFPREVLKLAFQHGILDQGTIWLEMLEQRNLLAHTFNEASVSRALYQPAKLNQRCHHYE